MKKIIKRRAGKNSGFVSVNIVLDETGSMSSCKEATISGFNEYIQTLKNDKKGKILVSLTKFNSGNTEVVYTDKPLSDVQNLTDKTYQPNNGTPLYDAIGKAIAALKNTKHEVLFVIITDGEENASVEYKLDGIKKMITEKEKGGWRFTYLGANQDAWQVGMSMGMHAGNTINYVASSAGTGRAFGVIADATLNFVTSSTSGGGKGFSSATSGINLMKEASGGADNIGE